jgi:hypothetical protein
MIDVLPIVCMNISRLHIVSSTFIDLKNRTNVHLNMVLETFTLFWPTIVDNPPQTIGKTSIHMTVLNRCLGIQE